MTSTVLFKEEIKFHIEDYLFKTSSDPQFISFLYQNKDKIRTYIPNLEKYLQAHDLFEKR